MKKNEWNNSLQGKMIKAFIITSILPLFIIAIFSYVNTAQIVRENAKKLNHKNLEQTKGSLDVWMDSYEDILFQAYMNDDVVDMVDQINNGKDTTLVSGQLRRILHGMFYTKEYIKSITIITESGNMIFYDLLTGSTTKNSWIDTFSMTKDELYQTISADNKTHFISTEEAGVYAADTYYLFHFAHRIIDYRNVDKKLGMVIVSIDEKMLKNICNNDVDNSMNFIVDRNGQLVSCQTSDYLGKKVIDWSENIENRKSQYLEFVSSKFGIDLRYSTIDVIYDENFECDIINISNQNIYINKLKIQRKIIFTVMTISIFILVLIITGVTKSMMKSIHNLTDIMKKIGNGELEKRAEEGKKIPTELNMIAVQFNSMLDKLQESLSREKEANEKQKNAEIEALEAQINPHFLYNTLDTINWMAIDREEFEISNSIICLAGILRYGIDKSNSDVTVAREIEWLKQYLFLQQTRLKNTFECEINVNPEIEQCKIHKLLFQPFVENAILHGFDSKREIYRLEITMESQNHKIAISILDNGRGIEKNVVEQMNCGKFPSGNDKNCIGMENAITRIKMYYGEAASVVIESEEGEYTKISILLPQKGDVI